MRVPMRCCQANHKGEVWTLELDKDQAQITDSEEVIREIVPIGAAGERLLMPSFSESIKQVRAVVDGELWYFDVDKEGLRHLKAFLDRALLAAGPEAIEALKSAALRDGLIGLGITIVAVGASVLSVLVAAAEGGQYVVLHGLTIFGLVMLGKGIYGYVRYRRVMGLQAEAENEI